MFERTKGKSFRFSSVSSEVESEPDFPTGSNPKVPAPTGPATLVLEIFTLFKKGIHPGLVSSGIFAGTEKKETNFVRTLPKNLCGNRYRAELERQLEAMAGEKENLAKRLDLLRNKLEAATDDKNRYRYW